MSVFNVIILVELLLTDSTKYFDGAFLNTWSKSFISPIAIKPIFYSTSYQLLLNPPLLHCRVGIYESTLGDKR